MSQGIDEARLLFLRTLCYSIAIVLLPITNLVRYVQLRLNQTMLGNVSARQRYQATIIVSMCLIELIGILGLIMFLLGDGYNTLTILVGMSALGIYLYRPKVHEYQKILQALTENNTSG